MLFFKRFFRLAVRLLFLVIFAIMMVMGTGGAALAAAPLVNIRFDPGYLYLENASIEKDFQYWVKRRIHRVEILLNNPVYGAYFDTRIQDQLQEQSIGRSQQMKSLVQKLRAHHIEAYAWFYPFRSKEAWMIHSNWRVPHCGGARNEFLLDVSLPEVRSWYRSVVLETVQRFKQLNGVDFAEPISNGDCEGAQIKRTRALTLWLKQMVKEIHLRHKQVSFTPSISISTGGHLASFQSTTIASGLNLLEVLKGVQWDEVYPELNVQDWKKEDPSWIDSNVNWPGMAYQEWKNRLSRNKIKTRTMGVHLELQGIVDHSFQQMLAPFPRVDLYETHFAVERDFKFGLQSGERSDHHRTN